MIREVYSPLLKLQREIYSCSTYDRLLLQTIRLLMSYLYMFKPC